MQKHVEEKQKGAKYFWQQCQIKYMSNNHLTRFIVDYLVSLNIRKGSWEMQNETIMLEEAAIQQNRLDMNSKIHLWM